MSLQRYILLRCMFVFAADYIMTFLYYLWLFLPFWPDYTRMCFIITKHKHSSFLSFLLSRSGRLVSTNYTRSTCAWFFFSSLWIPPPTHPPPPPPPPWKSVLCCYFFIPRYITGSFRIVLSRPKTAMFIMFFRYSSLIFAFYLLCTFRADHWNVYSDWTEKGELLSRWEKKGYQNDDSRMDSTPSASKITCR